MWRVVRTGGGVATGTVKVKVGKKTYTGKLRAGKVTIKLGKYAAKGKLKIEGTVRRGRHDCRRHEGAQGQAPLATRRPVPGGPVSDVLLAEAARDRRASPGAEPAAAPGDAQPGGEGGREGTRDPAGEAVDRAGHAAHRRAGRVSR